MVGTFFDDVPHNLCKLFEIASYFLSFALKPKKMDTYDFVRNYQTTSQRSHLAKLLGRFDFGS
jgi:hypothetical protein